MKSTTTVRIAVARWELTPSIPTFARMEVSAANIDDKIANSSHIRVPPTSNSKQKFSPAQQKNYSIFLHKQQCKNTLQRFFLTKWQQILQCIRRRNPDICIVNVQKLIAVTAHSQFLHIRKLAQTVSGLYPLHKRMMLLFLHGIDDIHTSLIQSQFIPGYRFAPIADKGILSAQNASYLQAMDITKEIC